MTKKWPKSVHSSHIYKVNTMLSFDHFSMLWILDGRTDRGRCPASSSTLITNHLSRARVPLSPMTILCFWADVCLDIWTNLQAHKVSILLSQILNLNLRQSKEECVLRPFVVRLLRYTHNDCPKMIRFSVYFNINGDDFVKWEWRFVSTLPMTTLRCGRLHIA